MRKSYKILIGAGAAVLVAAAITTALVFAAPAVLAAVGTTILSVLAIKASVLVATAIGATAIAAGITAFVAGISAGLMAVISRVVNFSEVRKAAEHKAKTLEKRAKIDAYKSQKAAERTATAKDTAENVRLPNSPTTDDRRERTFPITADRLKDAKDKVRKIRENFRSDERTRGQEIADGRAFIGPNATTVKHSQVAPVRFTRDSSSASKATLTDALTESHALINSSNSSQGDRTTLTKKQIFNLIRALMLSPSRPDIIRYVQATYLYKLYPEPHSTQAVVTASSRNKPKPINLAKSLTVVVKNILKRGPLSPSMIEALKEALGKKEPKHPSSTIIDITDHQPSNGSVIIEDTFAFHAISDPSTGEQTATLPSARM